MSATPPRRPDNLFVSVCDRPNWRPPSEDARRSGLAMPQWRTPSRPCFGIRCWRRKCGSQRGTGTPADTVGCIPLSREPCAAPRLNTSCYSLHRVRPDAVRNSSLVTSARAPRSQDHRYRRPRMPADGDPRRRKSGGAGATGTGPTRQQFGLRSVQRQSEPL